MSKKTAIYWFIFIVLFFIGVYISSPTLSNSVGDVGSSSSSLTSEISPSQTEVKSTITATSTLEVVMDVTSEKQTPTPESTIVLPTLTSSITPTFNPETWQELPVVPQITASILEIYERGLTMGNNPKAFSKVGDCESMTTWYLADFDMDPYYYELGDYQYLEEVIEYFNGSYGRISAAARPGFSAASLLSTYWTDRDICDKTETPLACEYRLHNPSFAIITLGTNDIYRIGSFEDNLRAVLDYTIEQGIVPILTTKGDNLEGDYRINQIIARLAYEYQIPLWNFWSAIQDLPDKGLQDDDMHLTFAANRFDDPLAMQNAWPVRNLTALQTLHNVMEFILEN